MAEAAALLILRKKAEAIWGGKGRGSLTSATDRIIITKLVQEAMTAGASKKRACEVIDISVRTLGRWSSGGELQEDQRPLAQRPPPVNKLTDEERKAILQAVNQPKFQSLPPSQIVSTLADSGIYMASESTMYRVMHEAEEQNHWGRSHEAVSLPMHMVTVYHPNFLLL